MTDAVCTSSGRDDDPAGTTPGREPRTYIAGPRGRIPTRAEALAIGRALFEQLVWDQLVRTAGL